MENKRVTDNKKKLLWTKIAIFCVIFIGAYWIINLQKNVSQESTPISAQTPTVITRQVSEFDASTVASEYVGRVEAIQSVAVRPQVSGEITKVFFKEGSVVKAGDPLYQIDPKQYQAMVQLRKAELEQANANLVTAEKYYKRIKATNERAISATDKETAEGNYLQAKASVAQAKANLKLAQIDLGYCKITAPITGKIGKSFYTKGNYVTPSVTELANIVQVDPIRVTYPMPDRDYLDQIESFKSDGTVYNIQLMLSNGSEYSLPGEREFENNTVDTSTGTITMNIKFKNPDQMLIPGEMVRVYTKPVKSEIVNVIPQTAIMADSEGDYVYVLTPEETVKQTRIKLGQEFGQMREVIGLETGTNVVISGIQNLRDGVKVNAQPQK